MQDHGLSQAIDGVSRRLTELRPIRTVHDGSSLIANDLGSAVVLVSVQRRDVESAVTEGAENDGAMADVSFIAEHNLQDGDITNHWSGDCGHKKENGSYEQEDHADPVGF